MGSVPSGRNLTMKKAVLGRISFVNETPLGLSLLKQTHGTSLTNSEIYDTSLKCEPFLLLKQRSEEVAKETGWEETNSSKNVANRDGWRGTSKNPFEMTSQRQTQKMGQTIYLGCVLRDFVFARQ